MEAVHSIFEFEFEFKVFANFVNVHSNMIDAHALFMNRMIYFS